MRPPRKFFSSTLNGYMLPTQKNIATDKFSYPMNQIVRFCWLFAFLFVQQIVFGQINAHNHGTGRMHPNAQMAVYADWTNTGSFVGNKGTAYFYGSRLQNLFGTNAMDFENLVLRNQNGLFFHVSTTVTGRLSFESGAALTPRQTPSVTVGFGRSGTYTGVTDSRHINGYSAKIGRDTFIFPIGGGGRFRPAITGGATNNNAVFTAAYYRVNPTFANLPAGAPFPIAAREPNLRRVCDVEYWDVKGQFPTQITLTWDRDTRVDALTDNELEKIVVAGWNGRQWVNLGNTAMKGDFTSGQVRSRTVVPDSFMVYTLAWGSNNNRCVTNAPVFDLGNLLTFCEGSSLTLNAHLLNYHYQSYRWNTGEITSSIDVTKPGRYWVTVWDSCGNQQSDTLTVRMLERVRLATDSALCYNAANGKIRIIGDTTSLKVWLNNEPFEKRGLAYLPAGSYSVKIRSTRYCDLDTTVVITQPPKNRVDIGVDTMQVRLNQTILLGAKPVGNFRPILWRWTPNDAMSCSVCQTTTAIVNREVITYQVTAVDSSGCQTTDEVTVFTGRDRPRYAIYVPNVFKPETEDYAVLGNPSQVKVKLMRIFDRWGELVFEARDFRPDGSTSWNGTFRGKPLATGAFVVTVEAEFIDGTTQRIARDITLIR
jgi:hypothetical protein